jgi:hypothetical protein
MDFERCIIVRTTLTLDEDIAAKLVRASRTSGKSFKEIVNATLRRGLLESRSARASSAFVVQPQSLGRIKPGMTLDKISALLEEADGPSYR